MGEVLNITINKRIERFLLITITVFTWITRRTLFRLLCGWRINWKIIHYISSIILAFTVIRDIPSHRNSDFYEQKSAKIRKRILVFHINNVKMAWLKNLLVLLSLILPIFFLEYYVMVPVFVTPVWNRALSSNASMLRKQTICNYTDNLRDRRKWRTSRSIYCDYCDIQWGVARKNVEKYILLLI